MSCNIAASVQRIVSIGLLLRGSFLIAVFGADLRLEMRVRTFYLWNS
jgi:hypothetical protein